MPSTASSTLLLELMATSENSQTWGTKSNTNLSILDAAICGTHSISTTGGTTTPANVDYTNDAAKKSTFDVTGTLVSNATIVIPNTSRTYRIFNRTTGAYTLSVKTSSGSAIVIPTSTVATVYCDGSNVVRFVTPISDYTTGAPATSSGAAASSVSVTPTGNLSSSNAQAALAELQGDIDTINTTLTSSYQPLDSDLTAIAALATTKGNLIAATGSAWSALAVGVDGYVLVAKSGASTGVAWSALVPATTKVLMWEASVTGWTIDTSNNNYAVRIVTSSPGGAVANTQTFTAAFEDKIISKLNLPDYNLSHTLDTVTTGTHNHDVPILRGTVEGGTGSATALMSPASGYSTGSVNETTTSDGAHSHGITGSIALGGSGTTLIDVSYVNVGIFAKNAY